MCRCVTITHTFPNLQYLQYFPCAQQHLKLGDAGVVYQNNKKPKPNPKKQQINYPHIPSTERAMMQYPNATLSELDVTMATWLTGPTDRDDDSNKMEEQTAAEIWVSDRQNPDDTNCHRPNGGADCCRNVGVR